jgi:hypothetical protein
VLARVAQTEGGEEIVRFLSLEKKLTKDRPAAVGYFIMSFVNELGQASGMVNNGVGQFPTIEITFGQIPEEAFYRHDSRQDKLEAEDYSDLFDMICRVEHGID